MRKKLRSWKMSIFVCVQCASTLMSCCMEKTQYFASRKAKKNCHWHPRSTLMLFTTPYYKEMFSDWSHTIARHLCTLKEHIQHNGPCLNCWKICSNYRELVRVIIGATGDKGSTGATGPPGIIHSGLFILELYRYHFFNFDTISIRYLQNIAISISILSK